LNLTLFLLLNAEQNASGIAIGAARFLAEDFVWLVPVVWARIYLGAHFPLDMAGPALVALATAVLMLAWEPRCVAPLRRVLMPAHRRLLARCACLISINAIAALSWQHKKTV